jgi:hypothetical protein
MKKLVQVSIALALMANVVIAQKKEKVPPGPLDKKTYSVDITEDAKKKPETVKDDLKFASGKFNCKMLMEEGFQATPYEATFDSTASPITCAVTVEATGEKELVFKWEGTITDDTFEGTAVLTKKGKIKKSYTFTGTLKGKKVKK